MKISDKARWVGPVKRSFGDYMLNETTYFRINLSVEELPEQRVLAVSANSRFRLYVNGVTVVDGPCKGNDWYQFFEEVDIAPYLTVGENVIAAKVVAYPPLGNVSPKWENMGPMSVLGNGYGPLLFVEDTGADAQDLSTGIGAWISRNDDAIEWLRSDSGYVGALERVYGERLPHGWETTPTPSGFFPVVAKWKNYLDPWGQVPDLLLSPRPIKPLIRQPLPSLKEMDGGDFCFSTPTNSADASAEIPSKGCALLPAGGRYVVYLDAGRLTTSFFSLKTQGGRGSHLQIGFAEAFSAKDEKGVRKDVRSDSSKGFIGLFDEYFPGGGDEVYSPFWFRTFRFVKLEVVTGDQDLVLFAPELVETRYPLQNKLEFSFPSQDWVNPVFDVSLRTLELCMHDTHEDCPFYEQLQYTMDTRLQILFSYALQHDVDMARRTIEDYHTSMMPDGMLQSRYPCTSKQVIPIFALHWILMLCDYYRETGDGEYLEKYRFTMEHVLHWFYTKRGESGLVEYLGYWDFADWTDVWENTWGVPAATFAGPSTIQNLTLAYVLGEASDLLAAMGYSELAGKYQNRKAQISETVNALCWDASRQMYREGPGFDQFSQHAQMWAVLSETVTGDTAADLMRRAIGDKDLVQCSFVMMFYLFRALEKTEQYELTEPLWEVWKELLPLDLSTVPEIPGPYTRSDCHAWGSLLLHEIPHTFFGVRAAEPGYKSLVIRPLGQYMGDFSGRVYTPRGDVEMKGTWSDGELHVSGSVPVPAKIVLPSGKQFFVEAGDFCV